MINAPTTHTFYNMQNSESSSGRTEQSRRLKWIGRLLWTRKYSKAMNTIYNRNSPWLLIKSGRTDGLHDPVRHNTLEYWASPTFIHRYAVYRSMLLLDHHPMDDEESGGGDFCRVHMKKFRNANSYREVSWQWTRIELYVVRPLSSKYRFGRHSLNCRWKLNYSSFCATDPAQLQIQIKRNFL